MRRNIIRYIFVVISFFVFMEFKPKVIYFTGDDDKEP